MTKNSKAQKRNKKGCHKFLFLSIFIICTFLFLSFSSAFAISKKELPDKKNKDLSFFLKKEKKVNDPNMYLYSSFSFINLNPQDISFYLTKFPEEHIIPFSSIEIFVPFETSVQSEYFDFTIWGQLGTFFNKEIEIVELENEIIALFEDLESVNKKYKSIFKNIREGDINLENILTLNKNNYFDFSKKKRNEVKKENYNKLSAEYVELEKIVKRKKSKTGNLKREKIKAELFEKKNVSAKQKDREFRETRGEVDAPYEKRLRYDESKKPTILKKFLLSLSDFFYYFVNHKVETLIYFVLLILCIKFIILIISSK